MPEDLQRKFAAPSCNFFGHGSLDSQGAETDFDEFNLNYSADSADRPPAVEPESL